MIGVKMTQKQLLFMELLEDDNKSDLAKYFIIWDQAQKELLEELRTKEEITLQKNN